MQRQLFIITSTRQRVANLPPVLETANPGDEVLWIEGDEARQFQWTAGPSQVFKKEGLHVVGAVAAGHTGNPADVATACQRWLEAHPVRDRRVVLVVNGGSKLTPVGVLKAWDRFDPAVLYGEDKPAVLWKFASGWEKPPEVLPYTRHALDLPELLLAAGHDWDRTKAVRLWPGEPALPPAKYGHDVPYTQELHAQHVEWAHARPKSAGTVSYSSLTSLLDASRLHAWRKTLTPLLRKAYEAGMQDGCRNPPPRRQSGIRQHVGRGCVPPGPNFDALILSQSDAAEQVYNITLNIARAAEQASAKKNLVPPAEALGSAFEALAGRRVVEWLDANGGLGIVQSAWMNVVIFPRKDRHEAVAELDVVLVLKNGILLHLECKTATRTIAQRDLDGRLLNLQKGVGSRLASMAICAPLYTAMSAEPWFKHMHDVRARVESLRDLPFIPMTLPGQPGEYELTIDGEPRKFACATFAEALDEFIRPYRFDEPSSPSRRDEASSAAQDG